MHAEYISTILDDPPYTTVPTCTKISTTITPSKQVAEIPTLIPQSNQVHRDQHRRNLRNALTQEPEPPPLITRFDSAAPDETAGSANQVYCVIDFAKRELVRVVYCLQALADGGVDLGGYVVAAIELGVNQICGIQEVSVFVALRDGVVEVEFPTEVVEGYVHLRKWR